MEEKQTRRKFSKEFKLEVIAQSYQRENMKGLAHKLGIRPELIYRWQTEYKEAAAESFPGNYYSSCNNMLQTFITCYTS